MSPHKHLAVKSAVSGHNHALLDAAVCDLGARAGPVPRGREKHCRVTAASAPLPTSAPTVSSESDSPTPLIPRLHPKIPHPNLHPSVLITIQIHKIYSRLIEYTPSATLRDREARVCQSNRRSADEIVLGALCGAERCGEEDDGDWGNETLGNGEARLPI